MVERMKHDDDGRGGLVPVGDIPIDALAVVSSGWATLAAWWNFATLHRASTACTVLSAFESAAATPQTPEEPTAEEWLDRPLSAQPEQEAAVEITGVAGTPCTDPHDNEVYAVFDLNLSSFPGQEQVAYLALEACLERFQAFVGREYEASVLDISSIYPTSESFTERDDREVVCSVNHVSDRKLIGSMRGSGQ